MKKPYASQLAEIFHCWMRIVCWCWLIENFALSQLMSVESVAGEGNDDNYSSQRKTYLYFILHLSIHLTSLSNVCQYMLGKSAFKTAAYIADYLIDLFTMSLSWVSHSQPFIQGYFACLLARCRLDLQNVMLSCTKKIRGKHHRRLPNDLVRKSSASRKSWIKKFRNLDEIT